jgi:hypothetical protein
MTCRGRGLSCAVQRRLSQSQQTIRHPISNIEVLPEATWSSSSRTRTLSAFSNVDFSKLIPFFLVTDSRRWPERRRRWAASTHRRWTRSTIWDSCTKPRASWRRPSRCINGPWLGRRRRWALSTRRRWTRSTTF